MLVTPLEMGNALRCFRPNDSADATSTAPSANTPAQRPPENRSVEQSPARRPSESTSVEAAPAKSPQEKRSSVPVQQTRSNAPRNLFLETEPSVERTQNYPRLHTSSEVKPSESESRKFPRQLSFWESQFGGLFDSLPDEWSISEIDGLPDISQVSI